MRSRLIRPGIAWGLARRRARTGRLASGLPFPSRLGRQIGVEVVRARLCKRGGAVFAGLRRLDRKQPTHVESKAGKEWARESAAHGVASRQPAAAPPLDHAGGIHDPVLEHASRSVE